MYIRLDERLYDSSTEFNGKKADFIGFSAIDPQK